MNAMDPVRDQDDTVLLARAVKRAKWRLLPFLGLMYAFAYLDRANIAFAKQAFQQSTGVSEAAFAFAAGIFFIGYAVLEFPSNLILHRVGARKWLSRIMVTWGLVAAAMAFTYTDTSFAVMRFLLGAAEAGFFPGVILYLACWFPARERGQVIAMFYLAQPISFIFGGPASGVLLDLHGWLGLEGWQIMFIVEGLMASLIGVVAYFYLTDRPDHATWMPQAERDALARSLAAEDKAKAALGTQRLGGLFKDPMVLQFALTYFSVAICGYGIAFYLPSQVSALLGVKVGFYVGMISAIPWVCGFAICIFWPGLAVRTGYRRSFAVVSLLAAGLGMIASGYLSPLFAVVALCIAVMGLLSAQPIFWTFPTGYLGGIAAAGGIALINSVGNLGGFVAPSLKTAVEQYAGVSVAGLWVIGGGALVAAVLVALIPKRAELSLAEGSVASGSSTREGKQQVKALA